MNRHRKITIGTALAILVAVSLSCNLVRAIKPAEDTPIPVSSAAVEDLEEEVKDAAATAASGGPVEMTFTEEQLTSLAAQRLQSYEGQSIKDIQIRLRDGHVEVLGTIESSGFDLPLSIVVEITVGASNQLQAKAVSGSAGPFDLPASLLEQLNEQISQLLADQYNPSDLIVESITIGDGKMTIIGRTR